MNRKNCICMDCIEKIFFIVCVTFLGMLFAFFKFGGIEEMGKCRNWCIAMAVAGFIFLAITVIALFCCCNKSDCDIPCCSKTFARHFTKAKEWNQSYWIDDSNLNEPVPNDRSIIFMKGGVDFKDINFSAPEKIEEIHFCASEISISTKVLQNLGNAKIFLDCGKTKIEIVHNIKNESTEATK